MRTSLVDRKLEICVQHTVTETSRNEHAPSQPFLLGLTAGDENSVSAEYAVCARLNAIEAVSD